MVVIDIKVKQKTENNMPIKKLDITSLYKNKLKNNVVKVKQRDNVDKEENDPASGSEYGVNKVQENVNKLFKKGEIAFQTSGKRSLYKTKQNIQIATQEIKQKLKDKSSLKINNHLHKPTKNTKKLIKDSPLNEKMILHKIAKKNIKSKVKGAKRNYQTAKIIARNTIRGVRTSVLATISTVKTAILATKALIAAIVAGGWVAILIIVLLCLISLICSSPFGIFFSSEDKVGDITMSSVIRDINMDFTNRIKEIQNSNEYDEYEIISNDRAKWKDILSIYAVIVSAGVKQSDVITLDDNKINKLKEIFWNMNIITSKVEEVEKEVEIADENGNIKVEKQNIKVLYIEIESKTLDEMVETYNFNNEQKELLTELQREKYASAWNTVIYGDFIGDNNIVQVALSQIGNVGGETYWRWYGFNSHVNWCACFVSWCANECGYIESGRIPKFSYCQDGVDWFKINGLWQGKDYIPKVGDIIFFDWQEKDTGIRNGIADHVGIVEKVENGMLYTIEGNVDDTCSQKSYDLNIEDILGYGIV